MVSYKQLPGLERAFRGTPSIPQPNLIETFRTVQVPGEPTTTTTTTTSTRTIRTLAPWDQLSKDQQDQVKSLGLESFYRASQKNPVLSKVFLNIYNAKLKSQQKTTITSSQGWSGRIYTGNAPQTPTQQIQSPQYIKDLGLEAEYNRTLLSLQSGRLTKEQAQKQLQSSINSKFQSITDYERVQFLNKYKDFQPSGYSSAYLTSKALIDKYLAGDIKAIGEIAPGIFLAGGGGPYRVIADYKNAYNNPTNTPEEKNYIYNLMISKATELKLQQQGDLNLGMYILSQPMTQVALSYGFTKGIMKLPTSAKIITGVGLGGVTTVQGLQAVSEGKGGEFVQSMIPSLAGGMLASPSLYSPNTLKEPSTRPTITQKTYSLLQEKLPGYTVRPKILQLEQFARTGYARMRNLEVPVRSGELTGKSIEAVAYDLGISKGFKIRLSETYKPGKRTFIPYSEYKLGKALETGEGFVAKQTFYKPFINKEGYRYTEIPGEYVAEAGTKRVQLKIRSETPIIKTKFLDLELRKGKVTTAYGGLQQTELVHPELVKEYKPSLKPYFEVYRPELSGIIPSGALFSFLPTKQKQQLQYQPTISKTSIKPTLITKPIQVTFATTREETSTKPKFETRQEQRQLQRQFQLQVPLTQLETKAPTMQIETPFVFGEPPEEPSTEPGKAYNAYVKKQATKPSKHWTKVNQSPLDHLSALGAGAYEAKNTASRSFKISSSKGPATHDTFYSGYWRQHSYQFYQKNGIYIQKSQYSISTFGELSEITFAPRSPKTKPFKMEMIKW